MFMYYPPNGFLRVDDDPNRISTLGPAHFSTSDVIRLLDPTRLGMNPIPEGAK